MADRTVRLGDLGVVDGAGPVGEPRRALFNLRGAAPGIAAAGAGLHRAGWMARVRALEERPRVVGPHARLGVVWFTVSVAAVFAGTATLVLLLAPAAGLAAVQALRSRRAKAPSPAVAGGGAVLLVVAAAFGPAPAAAAGGLAVLLLVVTLAARHRRNEAVVALLAAGVVGLAGAAPILLLRGGVVPVLVLVTFAAVYDASAYVVGTGAGSSWEGPAAGVASIAAVTLAVAAVLVPPFRGASPWVLGGLAAVLAPMGPYVASALMGDRRARVPALRRLDSLFVLAPVWCLVAAVLLD